MPTEKRRSCTGEDPGQRHRRVEERKHLCPLEFYRLESAPSLCCSGWWAEVSFPVCPPWSDKRFLLPPGKPASASLLPSGAYTPKSNPLLGRVPPTSSVFSNYPGFHKMDAQLDLLSGRKAYAQARGENRRDSQKCAWKSLCVLREPELSAGPSHRKAGANGKALCALHPMSSPAGDRRGPRPDTLDVEEAPASRITCAYSRHPFIM